VLPQTVETTRGPTKETTEMADSKVTRPSAETIWEERREGSGVGGF
jgi:hypothetical protein